MAKKRVAELTPSELRRRRERDRMRWRLKHGSPKMRQRALDNLAQRERGRLTPEQRAHKTALARARRARMTPAERRADNARERARTALRYMRDPAAHERRKAYDREYAKRPEVIVRKNEARRRRREEQRQAIVAVVYDCEPQMRRGHAYAGAPKSLWLRLNPWANERDWHLYQACQAA